MDQRKRKLKTMHKDLHIRDDVDRLSVSRKEGGIGFASIEDSVDVSTERLENYMYKRRGRLNTTTRNNIDNTIINRTNITWRKMGRKTTVWTFQTTNERNLTQKKLCEAEKQKP